MVENQWHLFNDFLVRHIPQHEALRFSATWKLPTVLAYQLKGARHYVDDNWKDCLDTRCLYIENSMKYARSSLSQQAANTSTAILVIHSMVGSLRKT